MKYLKRLGELYQWWIATLLEMLPESWRKVINRLSKDVEIVIAHQADTLIVQNEKGEIIEIIAQADGSEQEHSGSLGQTFNDHVTTRPQLAAKASAKEDTVTIDYDFERPGSSSQAHEQSVDILLVADDGGSVDKGTGEASAPKPSNVIPLSFPSDDHATVVIDDDGDQTLQLQDYDDTQITSNTIVINNDQGNVIHGRADSTVQRDQTVLFINEGGQIRQVSPDELEDLPQQAQLSEDITELVTDFNIESEPSAYFEIAGLLKRYQKKHKCLYLLPNDKFFILNLSYPIEAVLSIETVLRYDLEKHIPMSFDEVRYFYALNVDSESKRVKVEVAVIKADEYAELSATLSPYIGKRLICSTHGFYRKYGARFNFLEDDESGALSSVSRTADLHTALNWVLLLVLLLFPSYYFQYRVDQIDRSTASELARVKEILASVHEVNSGVRFGAQLVDTVNHSTHTVELLDTLSSAITRKAWINRLSFKNGEVTIKGEAESATQVSDDLDRTGLFDSIKFVSSIIKNPRSGKESFELQLVLKDSDA